MWDWFSDLISPIADWLSPAAEDSDAWNLLDQSGEGMLPVDAFNNYDYGYNFNDIPSTAYDYGADFNDPYLQVAEPATAGVTDYGKLAGQLAGPALGAGATLLGSGMQGRTAQKTNQANREAYSTEDAARIQAYNEYLANLNPPESVLDSRQQQLQAEIEAKAPGQTQRTRNVAAQHGVRGKGKASPVAQTQSKLDQARNEAYWKTHGNYNVPGAPRGTTNVPATPDLGMSDFLGKNLADIGSSWFSYSYAPEYLRRKY